MSIGAASLLIGVIAAVLVLSTLLRVQIGRVSTLAVQILISTLPVLLPLHMGLALLLWMVWALSRGAAASLEGGIGLLLSLFAVSGLAVYGWRQLQGRTEFDRALDEAGIAVAAALPGPRLSRSWLPLRFARPTVERLRDLSYGPEGVRNQLDIFRPRDARPGERRPVLLQVHGSGWSVTNKNLHALPLMHRLAENGWLVVTINYRLSPAAKFPAHLIDVKRAIAWIRDHIAGYGGDPGFIAVTGGSAGGHLATLAALTPDRRDLQPGFEDADTRVQAAVPIYARYDFLDRDHANALHNGFVRLATRYIMRGSPEQVPEDWELASPVSQVRADAPPFLVIHGTHDSVIPVEVARAFVRRLRGVSHAPVAYAELPGLQHAYDLVQSPATEFTCVAAHRFLDAVRRRHQHESSP
jgi:acetyl esterase/lipase